MLADFSTGLLRPLYGAVFHPVVGAVLGGLAVGNVLRQQQQADRQARALTAAQDAEAAGIAAEQGKLAEVAAAQRRLNRGGRGLLTYTEDETQPLLGRSSA